MRLLQFVDRCCICPVKELKHEISMNHMNFTANAFTRNKTKQLKVNWFNGKVVDKIDKLQEKKVKMSTTFELATSWINLNRGLGWFYLSTDTSQAVSLLVREMLVGNNVLSSRQESILLCVFITYEYILQPKIDLGRKIMFKSDGNCLNYFDGTTLIKHISYRRVQKERDEILYTVWSLVMVRNQLPAQVCNMNAV
ncbi:hypothetical protein WN51_05493 [Melipona quadrifasciata]|uniref:Uncharacterized protein n=1 Tax=Melipona quadrifasciata TaxID=166423 RepID=A0A0N0BKI3_9HYME|nr:hypothetical protein WN51_05493 [Melipona quadrifasciata]